MCLSHLKSVEAERLLQAYILIRKAFVLELSSMYQSHFKSVEAGRLLQAYILMGKAVLLFFYRKVSDRFWSAEGNNVSDVLLFCMDYLCKLLTC